MNKCCVIKGAYESFIYISECVCVICGIGVCVRVCGLMFYYVFYTNEKTCLTKINNKNFNKATKWHIQYKKAACHTHISMHT